MSRSEKAWPGISPWKSRKYEINGGQINGAYKEAVANVVEHPKCIAAERVGLTIASYSRRFSHFVYFYSNYFHTHLQVRSCLIN